MTSQECNWVETKWENWNFWWQKRWHRVLTVSSQSEVSKAITAVLLLSLPNIFILIAFSYYELLRSNTQHSTTIVFSLLSSSSSSYTMIKLQVLVDKDPGLTGNLLVERLVGAHVDLISKEEYAKLGSVVCFVLYQCISFYCHAFLTLLLLLFTSQLQKPPSLCHTILYCHASFNVYWMFFGQYLKSSQVQSYLNSYLQVSFQDLWISPVFCNIFTKAISSKDPFHWPCWPIEQDLGQKYIDK